MNFFNKYPYSDAHELNLDWIISTVKRVEKIVDDFTVFNKILWCGLWDASKSYTLWNIVQDNDGNGYISIQPVPSNVNITNTDYWVKVADYDALYAAFNQRITDLETAVGDENSGIIKDIDDINSDISNINSDISNINAEISDINYRLSNRKIILIGDSYNTGTGGGQSISTMVPYIAASLGINEADIHNYSEGGAGFCRNSGDGGTSFEKNLDDSITDISDDDKPYITDICVIGGANDWSSTGATLSTNINLFVTKAKVAYPNAKLWLFAVGWAVSPDYRTALMNTYDYYENNADFTFSRLYYLLQNKDNMGEVWHPNQLGVQKLGRAIGNIMKGGNASQVRTRAYETYMYFSNSSEQYKFISWCDPYNVYIKFPISPMSASTAVTITYSPNTQIGVGYCPYLYGFQTGDTGTYAFTPVHALIANSSNQFTETDLLLFWERNSTDPIANKAMTIYARTFNASGGALTNITASRIYIAGNTITIPIWLA